MSCVQQLHVCICTAVTAMQESDWWATPDTAPNKTRKMYRGYLSFVRLAGSVGDDDDRLGYEDRFVTLLSFDSWFQINN